MINYCNRMNSGFTSVELMVGAVAASILALTAGMMVYQAYDAWDESHAAVNLHREGMIASDLMRRAIRMASESDVTTTASSLTISNIRLYNNSVADSTVSFSVDDRDLVFDPDTGSNNDEIRFAEGATEAFVVDSSLSGSIGITLQLLQGDENITFESQTAFRN
jgi:Tfp pilus assembly protein PilW